MKAKLVPIGNSKGIRIPKAILEQCGLKSEVELDVRGGSIVVRPVEDIRQGWKEAFQKMHENGDDAFLNQFFQTQWDKKNWKW